MDLNHRPPGPEQASESHKRFIWRRLRDKKRYFPLLVVPNCVPSSVCLVIPSFKGLPY